MLINSQKKFFYLKSLLYIAKFKQKNKVLTRQSVPYHLKHINLFKIHVALTLWLSHLIPI